ncbi:MAG: hypothetical protein H0T59_03075 [Chloroflexi bacterium]|nr:hypothetical protein [Chloroflexota bacterium]
MTVRALQIPLDEVTLEALRRVSAEEERHPRIQAARLLRDALRARGAIASDSPTPLRPVQMAGSPR